MALTNNVLLSHYHRLKALVLRQRPIDLTRQLRSDVLKEQTSRPISPASAWKIYQRFSRVKCFADKGWLVQFGVYDFTGKPEFHFSLVRQLDCLEHWNDEYIQIQLLLTHPPTPELIALDAWDHWSFDHATLADFYAACEAHSGFREVIAHSGPDWCWDVDLEET